MAALMYNLDDIRLLFENDVRFLEQFDMSVGCPVSGVGKALSPALIPDTRHHMFISHNWLRELTGTSKTPAELRERLTMVGLAIDSVETLADDSVLDVEVPSNRPDCLSHIGIAREVSVIEAGTLTLPKAISPKTNGRAESLTSVEILDPDLCPRYAARIIKGVKIGPSPEWLAKRLEAIGQRPINNVADITNYVLHEMGQPLHALISTGFLKGASLSGVLGRVRSSKHWTVSSVNSPARCW